MIAALLSLAAAATFAASALFIDATAGRVGFLQLARWQMGIAFVLTAAASLALGGWRTVEPWQFGALAASSAAGIMLASTTYIAAIQVAGPRVTAVLFSLAAPFAVLLGWLVLGETIGPVQGAGVALVLAGILLAVLAPDRSATPPSRRNLWLGVVLGIVTSAGQATGSLFARPAMQAGVEPFTAMAIRSGLGAAFFLCLMALPLARAAALPARRDLRLVGASAFVGMFLGMSLLMAALARGDVGIVTTLSSTTPILILPMIWATTGRAPASLAWAGAAGAVAGTALLTLAG